MSVTQPVGNKAEITEAEFEGLKIKALQKVNDFTDYLKIITDLNSDREKIKTAIGLATALFVDENARIEVSNVNTGLKNKYKVKEYFVGLGTPFFDQVGYVFLATTEEGLVELEQRRAAQVELGVPVERVDPAELPGVRADDVLGAVVCRSDGVADPVAVTRELVRRAVEGGVDVREHTPAETVDAETVVIACGAYSPPLAAHFGVELPVRPLTRQLLETTPIPALLERLPMVVESETGFHFRRRGDRLVLAMADADPRWGDLAEVDEAVFPDRLARLEHRYPPAAGARVARAWTGPYDMTPDAHPLIGHVEDGVYAVCGFSGHGFMQAPAVGDAVAAELLGEEPPLDLDPYRPQRFASGAIFPETLVL